MAARPTGAAWAWSVDENSTATPPNATTEPSTFADVRRSSPIARAMSALVRGMVAKTTAERPDGTIFSPQ